MSMICFYHKRDLDGICSGAIVKYRNPECEMYGIDYGDPFPWKLVFGKDVIMVDYAVNPPVDMFKINRVTKSFLWIDHHRRVIEEIEKLEETLGPIDRSTSGAPKGYSACELTWQVYSGEPIPEVVRYIGRYDVWDHSNPEVVQFQYGLRTYRLSPTDRFWMYAFENEIVVADIILKGQTIEDYIRSASRRSVELFSFATTFEGYKAICLNSEISSYTFKSSSADFEIMVGFIFHGGSDIWSVSLRTLRDDIDVSAIAKKYGGGGHRQAAGFTIKDISKVIG